MDSLTVQLFKVCPSSIPKYFPISQNPLSFTWDNMVEPGVATIALGMRGALTKAKREQNVIVSPQNWKTHSVMRMLLSSGTRGVALTRLRTVTQFNAVLRKAVALAGLSSHRWTAHSARSGWATEQNLMGTPFDPQG